MGVIGSKVRCTDDEKREISVKYVRSTSLRAKSIEDVLDGQPFEVIVPVSGPPTDKRTGKPARPGTEGDSVVSFEDLDADDLQAIQDGLDFNIGKHLEATERYKRFKVLYALDTSIEAARAHILEEFRVMDERIVARVEKAIAKRKESAGG